MGRFSAEDARLLGLVIAVLSLSFPFSAVQRALLLAVLRRARHPGARSRTPSPERWPTSWPCRCACCRSRLRLRPARARRGLRGQQHRQRAARLVAVAAQRAPGPAPRVRRAGPLGRRLGGRAARSAGLVLDAASRTGCWAGRRPGRTPAWRAAAPASALLVVARWSRWPGHARLRAGGVRVAPPSAGDVAERGFCARGPRLAVAGACSRGGGGAHGAGGARGTGARWPWSPRSGCSSRPAWWPSRWCASRCSCSPCWSTRTSLDAVGSGSVRWTRPPCWACCSSVRPCVWLLAQWREDGSASS